MHKIFSTNINSDDLKITTFLNPFSYVLARNNKAQLEAFNIKIDGGMLVLILNLFGFKCKRKSFDMTSLAPEVWLYQILNHFARERSSTIWNIV